MTQQSTDILSKPRTYLGPILRVAAQTKNHILYMFMIYYVVCFRFNLQIVTSELSSVKRN